jgi:hypothetical protein
VLAITPLLMWTSVSSGVVASTLATSALGEVHADVLQPPAYQL